MIGFRYGDTRAEQLITKAKGLKHICYYIMNNPKILKEEGIFRIPGRATTIARYVDCEKNQVLTPPSLEDLDEMDAHTVCGLLKGTKRIENFYRNFFKLLLFTHFITLPFDLSIFKCSMVENSANGYPFECGPDHHPNSPPSSRFPSVV